MMDTIYMGSRVKDSQTQFSGVVVAIKAFRHGPAWVGVLHDLELTARWFDYGRLEAVRGDREHLKACLAIS